MWILYDAICALEEALKKGSREGLEARCERLMRRMFLAQANGIASRLQERRNNLVSLSAVQDFISPRYHQPLETLLVAAWRIGYGVADDALYEELSPIAAEMRQRAADRITGIDEVTRDLLRDLIDQALAENWAYSKLAREIRRKFREFSAQRAKLIAVTEIGQAYMDGQLAAARARSLSGVAVEKQWQTVGDDRVSDGCRANAAAGWIPLEDSFPSGHQSPLRFPGCRCAMNTRRVRATE